MALFDRLRDLLSPGRDDVAGPGPADLPSDPPAPDAAPAAPDETGRPDHEPGWADTVRELLPLRHPVVRTVVTAGAPDDLVELVVRNGRWLLATVPEPPPQWDHREHERSEAVLAAELKTAEDARLRAAAAYCLARLRSTTTMVWRDTAHTALTRLARRRLGWSTEQVRWLLRCTATMPDSAYGPPRSRTLDTAALAVGAAERLDEPDRLAELVVDLGRLLQSLDSTTTAGAKMVSRVNALLARAGGEDGAALPRSVLPLEDRFGRAARAALEAQHPPALVVAAVTALGDYGGSVVPTRKWRTRTEQLLGAQPGAAEVAATLLRALLAHDDHTIDRVWGENVFPEPFFVDQGTGQLLRAAVWTVALSPQGPAYVGLLGDVAVHCGTGFGGRGGASRLSPVTTSALAALAELATAVPDPSTVVGQLARVRSKVANRPIRAAADAALEKTAAAVRMTPGELLEQAVTDFGLAPDGTAEVVVGTHTALLALEDGRAGAKLTLRWRTPGGRVVTAVPAQVKAEHPEQLAELRALAKEAKTAVSVQRSRLEDLLADGRTWAGARWLACYAEHPVVGLVARSLLWQVRPARTDEGWSSGLPERSEGGWRLRQHDGSTVDVGTDAEVRLWHPLRQPLAEVRAWRAHLSDRGFRQPFKQAFREIYLLTPAEVETGTYSNRFAGHILRYPQAGALMRTRGWSGTHLGYWDGGQDGQATKELPGRWRATFYYETVEDAADGYDRVSLCATDQVRFERPGGPDGPDGGGAWTVRPVAEVPPLVLSEAMRDVDLFVGVTSVAADPEWVDHGPARYQAYWRQESFGDLRESAQLRREALQRLLPRTRLAGRAELVDRFLVVHGHLRDYKIHLGSGNILMSPADTYLCIVPARGDTRTDKVFLPFEEDGGKLSLILSKAFLLAEDTSIEDVSITRQLRAGL